MSVADRYGRAERDPDDPDDDDRPRTTCGYCGRSRPKIRVRALTRSWWQRPPGWVKLPNGLVRCPRCAP